MTKRTSRAGRREPARWVVACVAVLLAVVPFRGAAQETRAETSGWLETSRYEDVQGFVGAVSSSDVLHATTFGYSMEGRALPLVVVGSQLPDASAESVLATGRTRVLVMANIHAGEVEGKEAAQMLLRRFAAGDHGAWLDSLVVLVAPIYNADGNERVSVQNRYRQNGPLAGVGERANAQGLDLNRDHMKLESSEARSLVDLMKRYDPHVVVDLHTTNGTYHGYHLTYAPPLHPGTDAGIIELLRERWLPEVTRRVAERDGWRMYYYGNAFAPGGGERGWYTFDHRPRFNNNYVGLRNRIAILSEAYSYVPFRDRVRSTLAFVEAILSFAHAHATELDRRVRAADAADLRGRTLPIRARHAAGDRTDILMGAVEERLSPYSGRRYRARLDTVYVEPMREFGTFEATAAETVPAAYFVPAERTEVLDLLAFHGIRTTRLPSDQTLALERFRVDTTYVADREFQRHRERTLEGAWEATRATVPAGTIVVPMDQPLARLAFVLLEPRSDDGVVNWNLLDDALAPESGAPTFPILRRLEASR